MQGRFSYGGYVRIKLKIDYNTLKQLIDIEHIKYYIDIRHSDDGVILESLSPYGEQYLKDFIRKPIEVMNETTTQRNGLDSDM